MYHTLYEEKIKACALLFKRIASDFEKNLDKDAEEEKSRVAKGSFDPTFDGVRDNKDSIKKKALFSRKREKAIIIHKKCIIYKRPAYKNLEAYYYAFPKIAPKRRAPSARI